MAALIGWLVRDEEMPPPAWIGLTLAAGVALAAERHSMLFRRVV